MGLVPLTAAAQEGPAGGAAQPQPPQNCWARQVHECSCFALLPTPTLLMMVIQSRLNVQTFRFIEEPGQRQRNPLLPSHPLVQEDALTFPVLLENDFSASQFMGNEPNLFSLTNCTFSLPSLVPRRQEERASGTQGQSLPAPPPKVTVSLSGCDLRRVTPWATFAEGGRARSCDLL